jgi:acetyl esterase/lipase
MFGLRVMRAISVIRRVVVWGSIAAATAWVWRDSPPQPSLLSVTGIRLIEATVSGEKDAGGTKLDIYVPPADSSTPPPAHGRPAVLALHGGSWTAGSRILYRLRPQDTVVRLAQAGIVVIAPDYRLARPGWPAWPAVVQELRATIRWIRRHARELGVDPERIGVLGQSAGGHLAALLGTLPDERGSDGISSRVQAVVCFYGASDLDRLMQHRRLRHEPVRVFLGEAAAQNPTVLSQASPINHVTRHAAPMLLIHGTDDLWVPPDQSERMAEALRREGVTNRLIRVDGARHGFEALVRSPRQRDLLPEILAFLKNVWNVPY